MAVLASPECERRELMRREHTYRSGLAPLNLKGKTVILIDVRDRRVA